MTFVWRMRLLGMPFPVRDGYLFLFLFVGSVSEAKNLTTVRRILF